MLRKGGGGGGRGITVRKIGWGCAARFLKPLRYFRLTFSVANLAVDTNYHLTVQSSVSVHLASSTNNSSANNSVARKE